MTTQIKRLGEGQMEPLKLYKLAVPYFTTNDLNGMFLIFGMKDISRHQ